jgi:Fe-S cluster assembly protein SufD
MNTSTYSYKDIFKEQEKNLSHLQNSYIHSAKLDAFDDFHKQGFPTRKDEAWKYTNISSFTRASLNPAFFPELHYQLKKSDFKYYEHIKANKLVVINGSFQPHLSEIIEDPENITIDSVSHAIESKNPVFEKHFNSLANNEKEIFTALNTSMFGDGIFIHCKENKKAEYPIFWIFVSNDNSNFIVNPRNLIVLEPNASVEIIKDHQGTSVSEYFINAFTEIIIEENASLNMTSIENETAYGLHYICSKEILQKRSSNFNYSNIALSGKLIRNNIHVILSEPNAECDLKGVFYGKESDLIDNFIHIEHKSENCLSNQLYKGILKDESNGVFTGKIYVHPGANKTNAYQKNNNLLLSENATINSRPQLEIFADDVKCSHGATNGQIDTNALYYLKSRGLHEEMAQALLQYAFVSEVFQNIKNDGIRNYLEEVFKFKLGLFSI